MGLVNLGLYPNFHCCPSLSALSSPGCCYLLLVVWLWELLLRKWGANATLHLPEKGLPKQKNLNHFYLFHCGLGQSLWAGRLGIETLWDLPQPAAMLCALASLDALHQPLATEPWSLLVPSPELWCISSGVRAVL